LKGGTRWVKFFRWISVITLGLFDLEQPHLARWHIWRGTYNTTGSATFPSQEAKVLVAPKFLGPHGPAYPLS